MRFLKHLTLFTSLIFFTACSNSNTNNTLSVPSASLQNTINKSYSLKKNQFYDFYDEWKGVRYKYGGNSKSGIDCSAFIQKAYLNKFDIKIPRTTALQSKVGKNINKSNLKLGDLVFFKTGAKSRHVGIYMENGKFMHASTSKGVIISRLDNVYFKRHYWKSKRILD